MAFLVPDKIRTEKVGSRAIVINEKIIPSTLRASKTIATHVQKGDLMKPNKPLNDGKGPRGITQHNTNDIKVAAGTNAAEQYCRATYNEAMGGAVVNFYVWHSEIWQLLEETERGWHASDGSSRRVGHASNEAKLGGNIDTISIECIGDAKETEETCQLLCAYLCKKYNLRPLVDIYTHNYWMGLPESIVQGAKKNCPLYILPHWQTYLNGIQTFYSYKEEEEDMPKMYADIKDVPEYWRPQIQKLLDMDLINGGTSKEVNPTDVNLSEDTIKALVIMMGYIEKGGN